MAGTFGYEAEHYELSQQVGELKLFPKIRALRNREDREGRSSDCYGSRMQDADPTGNGCGCGSSDHAGEGRVEVGSMLKTSASRLSAALLGYMTLIILLLTLNPFYFVLPEYIHVSFFTSINDVVANILLFMPIGFLYRLTGGKLRYAFLTGALVSFGIETTQLFIPARTTSLMDFSCNTLGAGLGAFVYDQFSARISVSSGAARQLRLETPLMGMVYLLLPLLWMNGLALTEFT